MGATHADPPGGTTSPRPATDRHGDGQPSANGRMEGHAHTALGEDDLFDILANRRRRYILHELLRTDESTDIGTLSQEIAAREDGLSVQEVSSKDRKRVYTALHQSHLPKMDGYGVIEFDQDRGTVEPTPALEDIEIYMDVVYGRELPWSDYYLGLTALAGVLLAATAFSIGPFAALSLAAWGAFVVVSFGVFSLAHRYYARRARFGVDDSVGVEHHYSE